MTCARKLPLTSALFAVTLLASAGGADAQVVYGHWADGHWADGHWAYGHWAYGHWAYGHWAYGHWAYGHWEGMLSSPLGATTLFIDIGADASGKPIAALSLPEENINGLPLGNLQIDGDTIGFDMPIASEGSFSGALAADRKSLSGSLNKGIGSAEFLLARKGDARFPAPPKNPVVDARFEGEWIGGLGERGPGLRISLANQAGGAIGTVKVDDGIAILLEIKQMDETLTLDIASAGEVIAVRLETSGDLIGEFTASNGGKLPLKLQRTTKILDGSSF